jgi:hypothetical protein
VRRILFILRTLLGEWLLAADELWQRLCELDRRRKRRGAKDGRDGRASDADCVPIDNPAFIRPEPLIYDQHYLASLGFAITWDSPDIQLYRNGVPVSSHSLEPDTDYEVVARIWNASPDAPVIGMPVYFSELDFGISTVPVPIGAREVTVGVKGSASQPAFASMPWRTPAREGHYCIRVLLDPVDDSNYGNNLGQENTHVGRANSAADFTFSLHNDTRRPHRYQFATDTYMLGEPQPCGDGKADNNQERRRRMDRHRNQRFPLPDGWTVEISPETPSLAPEEDVTVTVTATPPAGWSGNQAFNVNAYHESGLAGGVTLIVLADDGIKP